MPAAQGTLANQFPELRENVGVPAAAKLCFEAALRDEHTHIVQPAGDRPHTDLVAQVRQRGTGPETEGVREGRRRPLEVRLLEGQAALLRFALETMQVKRVETHVEHVTGSPRDDRLRTKGLTQVRNGALYEIGCTRRGSVAPDLVDQPVAGMTVLG